MRQEHQRGACMLHLFNRDPNCTKCWPAIARRNHESRQMDEGSAPSFRNPYFSPAEFETVIATNVPATMGATDQTSAHSAALGGGLLLQTAPTAIGRQQDPNLHYTIESHIANLHNRQVTSSVQQLDGSIKSTGGKYRAPEECLKSEQLQM